MPFTDNGSFIETLLTFIPAAAGPTSEAGGGACGARGLRADKYLDCVVPLLDLALGPFNGAGDRFMRVGAEGVGGSGGRGGGSSVEGVVRFVHPKKGFNSHVWDERRPGQKWAPGSCWYPGA